MAARNSDGATGNGNTAPPQSKPSLPDSFYDMLLKVQGSRMDDQRASISIPLTRSNTAPSANSESSHTLTDASNRSRKT
ncbi:hypothetical protein RvY_01203 [Ramazzottius varieornatus]|uniref:Uncharacterized protein n=1 Tax=Ramazzottius varieornatus TaxID=947166 RepID=A0A1D1UMM7_RAMVA|nr:hypothetical protein RvY_01203 [Ramazzottius varieornatus]